MDKKIIVPLILSLSIVPALVFAFSPGGEPNSLNGTIRGELLKIVDIIFNILWPIAMAFFIIMFVVAGFMFFGNDPGRRVQARQAVLWGVVGVAVAVLAFSIPFIIKTQLRV